MAKTMVPEGALDSLRRLRGAVLAPTGDPAADHLHYDRGARMWRTHAELAARCLDAPALTDRTLPEYA
jgi:hypothetical protein